MPNVTNKKWMLSLLCFSLLLAGWGSGCGGGGGTAADTDHDTDSDPDGDSPLALPLLQLSDFAYQGAFRLPADDFGVSSLNYSQGPLTYNAAGHTIFIVGHTYQQAIAEFAVPDLGNGDVIADLPMAAAPVQAFAPVIDRVAENPQAMDRIGGLALIAGPSGDELLVNVYEYYDAPADDTHTTLVLRDAADLAGAQVDGFYALQGAAHASGWISPVPAAWQPLLGQAYITGNSSGEPIIGRLSVGPSAFAFNPLDIVGSASIPGAVTAIRLMDFSLDNPLHTDLANDSGANDLWTHLSRAVYGFIVPGTRTYATLGHSGGHASGVCYKCTPSGADQDCGGYCARDVDDYATYYWLWDVADLAAVRNGDMEPWELRPYAYGEFPVPFATHELGGGAYDAASGLLYLTLQRADDSQGTYANPPIVAVYGLP
jgi:hypothetical protein